MVIAPGEFDIMIEDGYAQAAPEIGVGIVIFTGEVSRDNDQIRGFKLEFLLVAELFVVSVGIYMNIDISPVDFLQEFGVAAFRFGIIGYDDDIQWLSPAGDRRNRQQNQY